MCYYEYLFYVCCSDDKEYDGIDLVDVEYCNECPLSSDGQMYDDDFFHCPYATAECLGGSDRSCPACRESAVMEDNHDDLDKDKEPDDDFSEYSDAESECEWFPPGEYDRSCWGGCVARFSDLLRDLSLVHGLILTIDVVHRL